MSSSSSSLPWSTPLPASKPNRTPVHRSHDPLATPSLGSRGVRTLHESLRRGRDLNPLGPCLGYRATSTNGYATPYVYGSYGEIVSRVDCISAGLARLKLIACDEDGMALLGVYMKNCPEWLLVEHAVYGLGGATVPFYDTLGPDAVRFILDHTGLSCVVCTRKELESLCRAKQSCGNDRFKTVILADGVTAEAKVAAERAGLEAIPLAKVEAMGAPIVGSGEFVLNPPDPEDVATFCYTSGTTGNPKGALHEDSNRKSGHILDHLYESISHK